ncbi:polyribonucleotide nucleotidyltransferase [Hymenobacter qilianensis]|uniref:Polyribonucleotide nucleotidyltransferase n=2 Tax=Hymenobacter qilianensis TaxID=1385715 RepID=A0ACB5PU22_9BACT|nr:polyribonucleotide nucleotidyltransferase [Hymenobacter qilianensis]QNP51772.1 polyribonucleotide nucleotidyltransferase [Hymenobacter qilianensis]GGF72034.1 polyribonucleotide nucleotidyltransferase [Hymenobacter qilianensis]
MPNYHAITKTITLPDGRQITLETGKLAKFADGAVVVRLGDAMLLATVVSQPSQREGVDFLPLSVDYQEKFGSAGKIPGSFQRREGRLSDSEILVSRLVDRILRPMFPKDYHYEVQVMISLISADKDVQPDALAALAASAALSVSDIPFAGPISEVRVARIDGKLQINPKTSDIARADIDLIVGATADSVAMVEGEMNEVSEEEMVQAIAYAHEAIKEQVRVQMELGAVVEKAAVKRDYPKYEEDAELKQRITDAVYQKAYTVAYSGNTSKAGRKEGFSAIKKELLETLIAEQPELNMKMFSRYHASAEKKAIRDMMIKERTRLDGRQLTEIRPIWSEINYLPGAHGSALFTRGETQSLTTVTLGTKLDEQIIDSAMLSGYSKFMLHYNFPAFSTGEVKPNRGPGRREIGHGNLAMRSLKRVLPGEDENPYTIRIVSDILESNGSSSMATVCAGSLALMDAGVKVRAAVSGIAMGLVQDKETGEYAVLSDILGDEDHLGDMDFKVTGTEKGIVACQMDIKIQGLSSEILTAALHQAREGRLHILGEMAKTISQPAADMKPHTPRSHKMLIEKEFIGAIIGPGGKVIQQIQKDTNATVIIEEKDEKGHVSIYASNQEDMEAAIGRIRAIAAQPEIGETYKGKVRSIQPYGAFVEIMPGKDGLLHISEVGHERLNSLEGVLEVGQEIDVKLLDIDKKTGKYRLSRKVLLPRPERTAADNGEAQA